MNSVIKKYQDRPTHFIGVEKIGEWSFKCYEVFDSSNTAPQAEEWKSAIQIATQNIQNYIHSGAELKIGYIIYHKGFDSNYIVISWWSHENMLRMFAYSSTRLEPTEFNLVTNGLNICVWDMLIHAHERDAFVKHILTNQDSAQFKNYLQDEFKGKI